MPQITFSWEKKSLSKKELKKRIYKNFVTIAYNMKGCLTTFTFLTIVKFDYIFFRMITTWATCTKLNKNKHLIESLCPKLCVHMMMMCSAWQMGPCHTKEGNLQKKKKIWEISRRETKYLRFFLVSRFVNIHLQCDLCL